MLTEFLTVERGHGRMWKEIALDLNMSVSSLLRLRRQLDDEYVIPVTHCATVAHPPDTIETTVSDMIHLHFSYTDMCDRLGVTRYWLRQWIRNHPYVDTRLELTQNQLDGMILELTSLFPNRGEKMLHGYMRSRNVRVTREDLRASINRTDVVFNGAEYRLRRRIKRRVYKVEGPGHLWHGDGCHKLRKWGLVVHAAIDGFSRFFTFIRCSDNNRSDTVLALFKEAVELYGCPSRLRVDKGGENFGMARLMLDIRGLNRNSVIFGPSTHNQRIERSWRDVTKEVLDYYRNLFDYLESKLNFTVSHKQVLYLFHHFFLDAINADLAEFKSSWNHHGLRTEHNKSPAQLMLLHNDSSAAIEVDVENYGVECFDSDSEGDDVNEEVEALVNSVREDMPVNLREQMQNTFPPFTSATCRDVDEVVNAFGRALQILT